MTAVSPEPSSDDALMNQFENASRRADVVILVSTGLDRALDRRDVFHVDHVKNAGSGQAGACGEFFVGRP